MFKLKWLLKRNNSIKGCFLKSTNLGETPNITELLEMINIMSGT